MFSCEIYRKFMYTYHLQSHTPRTTDQEPVCSKNWELPTYSQSINSLSAKIKVFTCFYKVLIHLQRSSMFSRLPGLPKPLCRSPALLFQISDLMLTLINHIIFNWLTFICLSIIMSYLIITELYYKELFLPEM